MGSFVKLTMPWMKKPCGDCGCSSWVDDPTQRGLKDSGLAKAASWRRTSASRLCPLALAFDRATQRGANPQSVLSQVARLPPASVTSS